MSGFVFNMSPNFSVTTHSLALPASNRPMKTALHRCNDITFSSKTQKIIRWNDLCVHVKEWLLVNLNFVEIKIMENGVRNVEPWSTNRV